MTQTPTHHERGGSLWPESRMGQVVLVVSLLLGSVLRLAGVESALLFGDEFHSLALVAAGYGELLTSFGDKGSGLALPLLQRLLFDVFGTGHWSIRAPAWGPALLLLFAIWPLGRRIVGDSAALAATSLVAISPILVFYARFGRIYSLVALLSLVLLHLSCRQIGTEAGHRARLVGLIAVTALLPWAHPTALGFVLPVFVATLASALLERSRGAAWRRRVSRESAVALGIGGLLCLIAHLPGWTSLWRFALSRTSGLEYYGEFGALDVASLLFGGRWPALTIGLMAAGGAFALWRRHGTRSLPLLAACIGPAIVILAARPYGDAYAYARYVLPSVVPVALLAGFGLAQGVSALRHDSWTENITLVCAAGLALILALAGPPLWKGGRADQHANTYLDLLPLPAFDSAWPDTPAFYLGLAELPDEERRRLRLVEVPALTTRARHLYRQYQLQHGVETWLAPLAGEFPLIPGGPYVALQSPDWLARATPDFVVVHLDISAEIARYWRFVYDHAMPSADRPDLDAYMTRHASYGGSLPQLPAGLTRGLVRLFGEPVYQDEAIAVWSTADSAASKASDR